MTILQDIAPRSLNRVIDVVETALIDVSAWAVTGNAANARYRYEWASFDATSRVALFCLGPDDCLEDEGRICCKRWSTLTAVPFLADQCASSDHVYFRP